MANIKSSAKAARQAKKRTAVNTARRTQVRGTVRAVEEAIASGDKNAAITALKAAEPALARGANKKVLHKNTAARKVSRLTKRVAAMGAAK